MNEHIKKLAAQALDKVVPYTWSTLDRDEVTKLQEYLAQSIIQECVNQVSMRVIPDEEIDDDLALLSKEYDRGVNSGLELAAFIIKMHFGVE